MNGVFMSDFTIVTDSLRLPTNSRANWRRRDTIVFTLGEGISATILTGGIVGGTLRMLGEGG